MTTPPSSSDPRANRLLARLPPTELALIAPKLEVARFARGELLYAAGAPVRRVWFPLDCVVSLTLTLSDGGTAETGAIGREGMAGSVGALGTGHALADHVVQLAGSAAGLDAARFGALVADRPAVRELWLRYNEALLGQVLHAVACNALHTVPARLARWLLTFQDRCGGSAALQLTQEFLAQMLGVHRPTVTIVARELQAARLIRYQRGTVELIDRARLEAVACECYHRVRALYDRPGTEAPARAGALQT